MVLPFCCLCSILTLELQVLAYYRQNLITCPLLNATVLQQQHNTQDALPPPPSRLEPDDNHHHVLVDIWFFFVTSQPYEAHGVARWTGCHLDNNKNLRPKNYFDHFVSIYPFKRFQYLWVQKFSLVVVSFPISNQMVTTDYEHYYLH